MPAKLILLCPGVLLKCFLEPTDGPQICVDMIARVRKQNQVCEEDYRWLLAYR